MNNFQNQILKQEILSEKMSEQNSEIENFQDKLFDCYVHKKNLTNMPMKFINFSQHIKNVYDIQM